jgi:hypothetical protein
LFKATRTERTRAPSVGSIRAFRPAGEVALVVHSRVLHPAPCRSPRALPAPSKAGRSIRAILTARILAGRPAPHRAAEKDASLRLLQPTHDTSTQYAARFPISHPSCPGAFRPRDPPDRDGPRASAPTRTCALAGTWRSIPRVELRLTANLQLRHHRNPQAASMGQGPVSPPATSTARPGRSLDRQLLRALLPGRGLLDRAPSMQLRL